ncbi:MAG: type pilus assembly protein PilQ [Blastocatellia bacterium]|jgi:Flp pilus assembly secretin CpaC|nr:type pilus assembly protein PilQ [Blastocatellia bacterium]
MKLNQSTPISRVKVALALIAAFAVAATVTFGARRVLGRSLDTQPSDAALKDAREASVAAIPRLPKDTEEKLAAALYPELPPLTSVTDPFVDRAGLNHPASNVKASYAGLSNTAGPVVPALPDRNARLSQWQQSLRAAVKAGVALPPMTSAYLISELAPTGKFDMGGREGVWLYLESERRTIAANVGTKFYDGMLVGVDPEGAQFRTALGHTKLVPWISKKDFSNGMPPAVDNNPSQQPIIRPAKPVSQYTAPKTIPQAAPQAQTEGDYADLQQAVRDRYTQPAPAPRTRVASPKSQPQVSPVSSTKDAKPTETQLPVSADQEILEDKTLTPESRDLRLNHVAAFKAEPQATAVAFPTPSPAPSPTASRASSPTPTPEKVPSQAVVAKAASTPAPAANTAAPKLSEQRNPICDPNYRGERISTISESDQPMALLTLVKHWNETYGANIVLDYDIQETPVRLSVTDTPWTSVLRTILDLNDLDTVCLDGGLVQIAKRAKIAQISDQRRKSAPIVREVFKLRYLQSSAGGRTTLAGQTEATNGATIQTLESTIRDILKAGGDARGDARQVPGRSELIVAATQQQMDEIRDIIARVDRPSYQVRISALMYTTNESRLRDVGSQLALVLANGANTNIIGGTTLPNVSTGTGSGSGTSNGQGVAGINPGGIPGLATGMRQPSNALGATTPLATFGASTLLGTAQISYQLTLAQQRGAINIQSRPFGIVSDGDTFDLISGTQIPVITSTIAGGAALPTGGVQVLEASRIARIKPQVAEDEHGRPSFITLNIQLENNSVDTSLGTFNGVPGINRQSLQTVLRLKDGETVIIGGLAADQVSNSQSKVPGLGDIPAVGNFFKRKQKQENRDRLYFAITVEVIPQDAAMPNFPAPADATTSQPEPPKPQKPSPFKSNN